MVRNSNTQMTAKFAKDPRAVSDLGLLRNVSLVSVKKLALIPEIFFGEDNTPLRQMKERDLELACALDRTKTGKVSSPNYPAEQVQIGENQKQSQNWHDEVTSTVVLLMSEHGISGSFQLSLKGFAMRGKYTSESIEFFVESRSGPFARMLVDVTRSCKGGEFIMSYGTDSKLYDAESMSSPSRGQRLYCICWPPDSTISMRPITSGFREFLVYDVLIDPDMPTPFVLKPLSKALTSLEQQVQKLVQDSTFINLESKTCYMPLLRILANTYRFSHTETPPESLRLYILIVKCFSTRAVHAMKHYRSGYGSLLPKLRQEGEEIIRSFGGETAMQCIVGHQYATTTIRLVKSLPPL